MLIDQPFRAMVKVTQFLAELSAVPLRLQVRLVSVVVVLLAGVFPVWLLHVVPVPVGFEVVVAGPVALAEELRRPVALLFAAP